MNINGSDYMYAANCVLLRCFYSTLICGTRKLDISDPQSRNDAIDWKERECCIPIIRRTWVLPSLGRFN